MDVKQIKQIVRTVLTESFENVEILSINITPDVDEDGDKILIVKVVFDGKEKSLSARETSGLARRILPQIGEEGFPVFSFIAKSELGKLKPESA